MNDGFLGFLRAVVRLINALVDGVGRVASAIVYLLLALLLTEVFLRYVLNAPTSYAHELSALLFSVMFLFGGAYALRWNAHVSVDVLHRRLSPRVRAAADLATWLLFYFFIGVLFWKSVPFALDSIGRFERSASAIAMPIWPVKACLPIAAALMLLAGISKTIGDAVLAFSGQPLFEEEADENSALIL